MDRPLQRVARRRSCAGLIREQVDGVRGVVPEQVVGPGARLAERVDVRAAEEVGLHVHLLDRELAGDDPLVHPLVARIEAARVADHRDQARLLLRPRDGLGVGEAVGERDLDLHVLARLRHAIACARVQLRGRGEDHRVDVRAREALGEVGRHVADAELARDLLRRLERAADERDDLDAVDLRERFEVLDAEGAGAGEAIFMMRSRQRGFSRMMWPTAVFDAGTW